MATAPIIWDDSFGSQDNTAYTARQGSYSVGAGRGGRNAYTLSGGQTLQWNDASTHKLWIVSFGFKAITGVGTNDYLPAIGIMEFHRDPTNASLVAGTISSGNFGETSATIANGAWIHVAVRVYFDASAGTVDIWFNESNVFSVSAVNTGFAPSGFSFAASAGNTFQICDLFAQASGTSGDLPFGDRAVIWLPPTADGTHHDFTPKTGTDHHAMVDEAPPDGDGSYNASATVGNIDTFAMADLATSVASIDAVVAKWNAAKTDAGTRAIAPLLRIGGTDYAGTGQNLGTSYGQQFQVYDQSPATSSAWSVTELNGAEAGVKVTA